MTDEQTLVLWNPGARQTGTQQRVREELELRPGCSVRETRTREEAFDVIREEVEKGAQRVIAAGGDGSANVVFQGVYEADALDRVTVAILPLGTGNDLARTLGMPLDPLDAIDVVFSPTTTAVDVLLAHWDGQHRVVGNMATAGNTGRFIEHLTSDMKQRWGPFCYLRGVIDVAFDLEVFDIEVIFDEEPPVSRSLLNIFCANGPSTGAGMPVAPTARVDDGLIDVVMIHDGTAGEIVGLAASYVLSDYIEHELVEHRQVRRVRFEGPAPMPLSIDGDMLDAAGIELVVTGQKIHVVSTSQAATEN